MRVVPPASPDSGGPKKALFSPTKDRADRKMLTPSLLQKGKTNYNKCFLDISSVIALPIIRTKNKNEKDVKEIVSMIKGLFWEKVGKNYINHMGVMPLIIFLNCYAKNWGENKHEEKKTAGTWFFFKKWTHRKNKFQLNTRSIKRVTLLTCQHHEQRRYYPSGTVDQRMDCSGVFSQQPTSLQQEAAVTSQFIWSDLVACVLIVINKATI